MHQFLIHVGILLHQYGTPAHRLERVMSRIANSLGVEGVFLYTPTALIFSIIDSSGESTYLRRVSSGAVDIDKLIRFDETLEAVEAGHMPLEAARLEFEKIADAPPPFADWISILACAVSCGAVAVFFRGTLTETLAATCVGLVVTLIEWVFGKLKWEAGLIDPVSGFVAAVGALAFANFIAPIDDRLVILASLIVLVPGLRLTVSLTELALGHLSAGVARLSSACVTLLTMTMGVALGWQILGQWRDIPVPGVPIAPFWQWGAIVVAPITFAICFRARWPQWPIITGISVAGFATSLLAGGNWGIEAGAFCGALCVGSCSNLYARLRNRPALVPLTPGIIVLVPGSLGFRSLTSFLDHETMAGIDFAFSMLIVAVALVGGILTSNVLLPPKRIL